MTDPISDMLTRIRNAVTARHARVDLPATPAEPGQAPRGEAHPDEHSGHDHGASGGRKRRIDALETDLAEDRDPRAPERSDEAQANPRIRRHWTSSARMRAAWGLE